MDIEKLMQNIETKIRFLLKDVKKLRRRLSEEGTNDTTKKRDNKHIRLQ